MRARGGHVARLDVQADHDGALRLKLMRLPSTEDTPDDREDLPAPSEGVRFDGAAQADEADLFSGEGICWEGIDARAVRLKERPGMPIRPFPGALGCKPPAKRPPPPMPRRVAVIVRSPSARGSAASSSGRADGPRRARRSRRRQGTAERERGLAPRAHALSRHHHSAHEEPETIAMSIAGITVTPRNSPITPASFTSPIPMPGG